MINLSCDTIVFPPRLLVWAGQVGAKVFVHTVYTVQWPQKLKASSARAIRGLKSKASV